LTNTNILKRIFMFGGGKKTIFTGDNIPCAPLKYSTGSIDLREMLWLYV